MDSYIIVLYVRPINAIQLYVPYSFFYWHEIMYVFKPDSDIFKTYLYGGFGTISSHVHVLYRMRMRIYV